MAVDVHAVGLRKDDTVCFINGTSCVGRDMDFVVELIGKDLSASGQQRSMTMMRLKPKLTVAVPAATSAATPMHPPTPGGLNDSSTDNDTDTDARGGGGGGGGTAAGAMSPATTGTYDSGGDTLASLGGRFSPRRGEDGLTLVQRRKQAKEASRAQRRQQKQAVSSH